MFSGTAAPAVSLLGVFKLVRSAGDHTAVRDRCYDSISIRVRGEARFAADGEEYTVQTGDLLYVPQNRQYIQRTQGETVYAVHFVNHSGQAGSRIECITPADTDAARRLIAEMYAVWNEQKPGYVYACTAMLYQLFYLMHAQPHADGADRANAEKIAGAVDFIHTHYKKDRLSVRELAAKAALSEPHFRRLFKEVYGVSPNRYIMDLRLEYASQLLATGLYSVGEVSTRAGFSDVKYFSRVFHRRFSQTPHQYAADPPKNAVY